MTHRRLRKSKICKLNRADIWGSIYILKKLTKFSKIKARRTSNKVSIGTFKGIIKMRPKNTRRRKTKYGRSLRLKQRLINFYGSIKNFQFKRYLLDQRKHKRPTFSLFIRKLESRLDMILYRSNFVSTIYEARQLINHKKVFINGKPVSKINTQIEPHDIININNRAKVENNIEKKIKFLFNYCPNHLLINYKTLEIGMHSKPTLKHLAFPFRFRIRRFLQLYKV